MIVYDLKTDSAVQVICPSDEKDEDYSGKLAFNGHPKLDNWMPIEFFVFNPLAKRGNFFSLPNYSAFACDKLAVDRLYEFLDFGAELLPIYLEDGTELFIVNVTDCVNALDQKNTVYDYYPEGGRGRILKYAFHKNRFSESSIFKIPETAATQVFTFTGIKSPNEEFYHAYNDSKLSGLVFELLFTAEE